MNYKHFGFFLFCLIIENCRLISSKYTSESKSQLLEKDRRGSYSAGVFDVKGLADIRECAGADASTLATPLSVYVTECHVLPCRLNTSGKYDLYMDFIAEKDAPTLEATLTGILFGVRFELLKKDICKNLVRDGGGGSSCPLQKWSKYLLGMEFDLGELIIPSTAEVVQGKTIQMELNIRDPDEMDRFCGVIPAEMF